MSQNETHHWADLTAERIIQSNKIDGKEKDSFVLASGITPSGTVHFGNFREVITTDFVARALRRRGKKVRFIFSWDDYDTFRKVPKNMPKQEELAKCLFTPIVDTPDPYGKHESYAAHHEKNFEGQLSKVGIQVEFLYQAKKYRAGEYRDLIKLTLDKKEEIRDILNQYRSEPLEADWLPISIYAEKSNTDQMKSITWDGKDTLNYETIDGEKGSVDLKTTSKVKLPWRMDWPMRWSYEKVDFEPGGKDHSSQGGSYTTAKDIAKKVYGVNPPVYLQYDFVSIKGGGGKMSSSSGEVVTVDDVLQVYEPEMVRWIFASYKSNVDFSVSFDLDVIKSYEDYDRLERIVYGLEPANDKKKEMSKRVYEISQLDDVAPEVMPFQPSFRHLTNVLQIYEGNLSKAREYYQAEIKNSRDERRFNERSTRALFWLENYAPADFKFKVNNQVPKLALAEKQEAFLKGLKDYLEANWDQSLDDKKLHNDLYEIMHKHELMPNDIFSTLYQILISLDKGPKLASFMLTIGREKVLALLRQVL
jgi:lysyl-tRNA synthetase, class I